MKHNLKLFSLVMALLLAVSIFAGCSDVNKTSSSVAPESTEENAITPMTIEEFYDYTEFLDETGFLKGVKATDFVTLPDFDTLVYDEETLTVSEETVEDEIEKMLASFADFKEVDRAAQEGDMTNIDYLGSVDGVEFTGGKYEGFDLTLGSGQFIEGFEDQIIGHSAGEEFDINVTFPEGYNDSTDADGNTIVMSGANAVFKIKLNSVNEPFTPTLTDEFVSTTLAEAGNDWKTAQEVREYIAETLLENQKSKFLYTWLMDNSEVDETPESVIKFFEAMSVKQFTYYASNYGMEVDAYLQASGFESLESYLEKNLEMHEASAEEALIIQAVLESQNLVASEEDVFNLTDLTTMDEVTEQFGKNSLNFVHWYASQDIVHNFLVSTAQANS